MKNYCRSLKDETSQFLNIDILFLVSLFLLYANFSLAQSPLITNTHNRVSQSLNGQWKYIIDPYQNGYFDYRYTPFDQKKGDAYLGGYYADAQAEGESDRIEYNFDTAEEIYVPGDWNSQKEQLLYYEGSVWYRKTFSVEKIDPKKRYFLYFGAANYEAHVYLNTKKLGTHIGGFTPFNFEITDLLQAGDNSLVVKVDNTRKKEAVPTLNTDWWNYGGLTRDVKIIEVSRNFVRDYQIQLNPQNPNEIIGYVQLDGTDFKGDIAVTIPELKVSRTFKADAQGRATIRISDVKAELWSPDNPKLYTLEVGYQQSTLKDQIGFRTIRVDDNKILLNGAPIFLRGVCLHEENPLSGGRAFSREDAQLLLNWAKEMNANYLRLAHYPHNEYMARLADEMGILLWEEIPVYWTIDYENPATLKNASQQLSDLIKRDNNRASVIIWSVAIETPVNPVRTEFLKKLAATARSLDKTRLVTAALEVHSSEADPNTMIVNDPAAEFLDIVSFNQYLGWYNKLPEEIANIKFKVAANKPVLISEFGGGALAGKHGSETERWTEEFQASLYRESIKMLEKIDNLSGITPWILTDFKSPRRPLADIQDGYNRKGLIGHRGEKKEAFHVMQQYYADKKLMQAVTGRAIKTTKMSHQDLKVKAPFDMPILKVPVFPARIFDIADYGAKAGGEIKNTEAIASAIAACHEAGGGYVLVPKGQWLTGKVHLKSNVNLHLVEGAELLFNDDPNDYLPAVLSSWEGMELYNYSPLIYALNCENIALSGKGTIRAKMDFWTTWFSRPPAHMEALKELHKMASTGVPVEQRQMAKGENNMRPQLIQFNRCKNILIEDLTIRNSPFWTIHLVMVDGGVVRRLDVAADGHNNDGIDPEMTRNLLIEDCVFDQGDDAISIKAGRNQDAWALATPSENIVIRNIVVKEGNQLVALGSELSGGIRNVYIHDCVYPYRYKARLDFLLLIKTNHRRGGFVENIYMENVHAGRVEYGVLGIETDVLYQWRDLVPTYETRLTTIKDIYLTDINVGEARTPIVIKGDERQPVKNVILKNIKVAKSTEVDRQVEHVENYKEVNVEIVHSDF